MKNRLSFSRLVKEGAIKTAAPLKRVRAQGTAVTFVDASGRMTASARAALARFLKQARTDQEAIEQFAQLLTRNRIDREVIQRIVERLKGMLTGPTSLFGQIHFASPSDRVEAIQALLDPITPKRSFALSTRRPVQEIGTGHTNVRLQSAAQMGLIAPAYVKGNVLYIGDESASSGFTIQMKSSPVNVYKGDLAQLVVDLLDGVKTDSPQSRQEANQSAQATINKIKSDPRLSDKEKKGLIERFVATISRLFAGLFGGSKRTPREKGTQTSTTQTSPTSSTPSAPTTPNVKTLGLIMVNRLYRQADRLAYTPIQAAVSMYLRRVKDALGRRVDPSKVEVLLGPSQEVAGTLEDIFSKGINFYASGRTAKGNPKYEIGLRHPLFKMLPNLGTAKAVAREVQDKYPDDVIGYEENKDGDVIKMTFIMEGSGLVTKEPTPPRAPGYDVETGTARGVVSKDTHKKYMKLMKYLPIVKTQLQKMKSPEASDVLRILAALELYHKIYSHVYSGERKGLMGSEISDAIDLLSEGLTSPDDLVAELLVQKELIKNVPGMQTLLARVPEALNLSTFNPKQVAQEMTAESQKSMGIPEDRVVIKPRTYGPGSYQKKLDDLASYINSLKTRYPDNKTLQSAIADVEGRIAASLKGEDRLTSTEIKKIQDALQRLAF